MNRVLTRIGRRRPKESHKDRTKECVGERISTVHRSKDRDPWRFCLSYRAG